MPKGVFERRLRPLHERFWRNVNKLGPIQPHVPELGACWVWRRSASSNGYGQVMINKRKCYAHRVSWELTNGAIEEGLWVLHKCDFKRCVRPDHLFLGTVIENTLDCISKGRHAHGATHGTKVRPPYMPRGEANHHAKLTANDVRIIRSSTDTNQALAKRLGVSRITVHKARAGITWRHIA